ncbi:MAG: hypothetical protein ABIR30_07425 [Chitinophagaceae bacterium]
MIILQIEHQVPSYEGWKKAFESDPINRKASGVKEFRVYRSAEDPNYIVIDLVFEKMENAQATQKALEGLWGKIQGTIITSHKTRILELTEFEKI